MIQQCWWLLSNFIYHPRSRRVFVEYAPQNSFQIKPRNIQLFYNMNCVHIRIDITPSLQHTVQSFKMSVLPRNYSSAKQILWDLGLRKAL